MYLIAITPGIPLLGFAVTAPTLVVLLGGAFYFANSPQQRMANLIAGFVFSITAILAVVFLYNPVPNSWSDENHGLLIIGAAPIGAAVGIALCMGCRRVTNTDDTNDILS